MSPERRPNHSRRTNRRGLFESVYNDRLVPGWKDFWQETGRDFRNWNRWSQRSTTIRMSRRRFLGTALGLVGAGAAGALWAEDRFRHPGESPKVDILPLKEVKPSALPFNDPETNEIAKDLGVHAGSFFSSDPEMYSKFTAFKDLNILLPIFPPAVYQYKDLIYQMSEKSGIPVNALASIVAIESWGDKDARSDYWVESEQRWGHAHGLFQIDERNFWKNGIRDEATMKSLSVNAEYGINIFNLFMDSAKNNYPDRTGAALFLRAFMGYNAGFPGVTSRFYSRDISDEPRFYHDFAYNYFMTAEIAARLKKRGYDDATIVRKLYSTELRARANILRKMRAEMVATGSYTYQQYERLGSFLGQPEINPNALDRYQEYADFFNKQKPAEYLSPATLAWYVNGGYQKYDKFDYNVNFKDWDKVDCRPKIPRGKEPDNSIIFDQLDPFWQGDDRWYGAATCGPTTVATFLRRFGDKDATPASIDKTFQQKGYRKGRDAGTLFRATASGVDDVVSWLKREKNYEAVPLMDTVGNPAAVFPWEKAKQYIDQGYLLVVSGMFKRINENQPNKPQVSADHIMGIDRVSAEKRTFNIFDPWEGKIRERSLADFDNVFYLYAVKPK